MSALQSVMEAYAGRTKELIQCEGYIREIIQMIGEDYSGGVFRKNTVIRDAEPCKKLEQTLARFFGIKGLSIYWKDGTINAYSVPGSSIVIASRDSSGDFTTARLHLAIYANLVYDAGLNERELMAVILHEIGHCFYCSPVLIGGELLGCVLQPMNVIVAFIGSGVFKVKDELGNFSKRSIPFAYNLINKFNHFCMNINYMLKYFNLVPNVAGVVKRGAMNLTNPLSAVGKYGGERGADSFAVKYGYAADQMTALQKIMRPENIAASKALDTMGGFGDFMADYNQIITELVSMMSLDPHPSNDVRAQAMIRKLERDLQTGDYPPELKKDLQKEIIRVKTIYKTIDDNKSNVEIKKAWHNMLNAITDGHSDIREIFDKFFTEYEF